MSNPPEAALFDRPDVQQVEGEAVARAILRYLNSPDPGSGFTEPYPRTEPPSRPGRHAEVRRTAPLALGPRRATTGGS